MKVSVVVRSLNEERHIGRLLTGLASQTRVPDEVVLVDSGSTDATVSIATRFANVRVVEIAPADFSFGRSLNLGCREATGDVLVIASAHVYPVYDTWIERMVAPFGAPDVVLTYGRQVGDERTTFSEHQVLAQWFPPDAPPAQEHPFCNNANAAVRRSTWEGLPYDESLTGLEDLDWAKRAVDKGGRLVYVPDAPVVHVHEEAWSQLLNRYRREAIAHRAIYPEQRMRAAEAIGLGAASIASDLWHAARQRELARHAGSIVRFRVAQFLGTYRGFSQRGPVTSALKRRFYYPPGPRRSPSTDDSSGSPIDYGSVS